MARFQTTVDALNILGQKVFYICIDRDSRLDSYTNYVHSSSPNLKVSNK